MNARSETERTKLIDSAGLTGSNSQFANKLCTFKGTTEANARLVDGEDESEEWLKALNVDVDKWTDDDAPKLRQDEGAACAEEDDGDSDLIKNNDNHEGAGCADKEDIRENDLTENRDNHLIVAPHNSTEDDVTNFNGVISASSVPINSLFMLHMKTEDIIGLDGIERIKQASSYVYDNFPMPKQQEEERQNIQKIPDEKKKEEFLHCEY
ncbi:hypothetical protein MAR_020286 [Mya arenaria]|uniref:Uncharacterized protein n=1 Tax=Mya arenaria TaxID=6604 RepID=A0ABY7E7Y0_MYAAR|nr:hypothetical protein MAR_020286 [Mya arenaria]